MIGLLRGVFIAVIIIFIALLFMVQMIPQYEANVSSSNISNSTTSLMVDLSVWVVPVIIVIGIILSAFALLRAGDT